MARHHHQWESTNSTYNPPNTRLRSVENTSESMLQRMQHGFTNVTQECRGCGEVTVRQFTGKVEIQDVVTREAR